MAKINKKHISLRIFDKRQLMPWLSGKKVENLEAFLPEASTVTDSIRKTLEKGGDHKPISIRIANPYWEELAKGVKRKSSYKKDVIGIEVLYKRTTIAIITKRSKNVQ